MHTHLFLKAEKEALKIRNTFDRIISIWTLGMLPAQTLQGLTLLWQLGDTIFVFKLLNIHLIFLSNSLGLTIYPGLKYEIVMEFNCEPHF